MKREKRNKNANQSHEVEIQRGTITDNALKALVTSPVFKMRVEKPKKVKEAFSAKQNIRCGSPTQKLHNVAFE